MTECDVVLHKALHNTITNNPSFQLISHQNIALQLMFSFYFSLHYSTQPVTACNTHMATRIFFSSNLLAQNIALCYNKVYGFNGGKYFLYLYRSFIKQVWYWVHQTWMTIWIERLSYYRTGKLPLTSQLTSVISISSTLNQGTNCNYYELTMCVEASIIL